MRLIGFNFKKISVEKLQERPGSVKFDTKLDILSIDSLKSDFLRTKDELLKVDFIFSVLYEPNFARLDIEGNIIISVEPKIAREVLKGWKDKELSEEFRIFMFNTILRKTNVKALQLEDDMGLPPHIPLPSLNKENAKENREDKEK